MKRTVLVTGASRGIGLEYVRQLLESGDDVIATAREALTSEGLKSLKNQHNERLTLQNLDVENDVSVAALAQRLKDRPIDVLINNAGIYTQDKSLSDVLVADLMKTFEVNVAGPLRVTRAFLPNLKKSKAPKIAMMSSLMGSIADNGSGGAYSYRMSKSALNMMTKNLALEMKNVITICLHPGWVQTDMGGPNATLSARESVRGLLAVIERAGPDDSGRFYNYADKALPW